MSKLAVACAFALVAVSANAAQAVSIELTNPYFRVFNGIFGHVPGDVFATTLVSTSTESYDAAIGLSHDLGFAAASASAGVLSIEAAAWVDFAAVGSFSTDQLVAEGGARFEADLRVTGGEGSVLLAIDSVLDELSSTTQPGFAIYGESSISIWENGQVLFGTEDLPTEGVIEYGRLYRLQMRLTAYTFAATGNRSANTRSLSARLFVIPEPSAGVLIAVGASAAVVARSCRRRGR